MTGFDVFNISVSVLGIISFIFSVWVWIRSDTKIRELSGVIDTILDISRTAIWEWQQEVESSEKKIQRAEKMAGYISSIQKVSSRYTSESKKLIQAEGQLGELIQRGVIFPGLTYDDIEMSKDVTEIWVITPDLKPDSSSESVGRLVNKNLKSGKKYIFFYPDDLPHAEIEAQGLLKNVGITKPDSKLQKNLRLVPISRQKYFSLNVGVGNATLYFRDEHRSLAPKYMEEIVLSQVPERGAFWQEHSEEKSKTVWHILENTLKSG